MTCSAGSAASVRRAERSSVRSGRPDTRSVGDESCLALHAWSKAKAEVLHAIYERITVAGPEIVGVRLTAAAYAHGLALALPEKVEMARPTGVGRALATYDMPIEGRNEWIAAARLQA